MEIAGLSVGSVYRRGELHERFGGQRQGGISTPSDHPVLLLFTGHSGNQHGYDDGWTDGVFCYFGEGQTGDMEFIRGNRAVRDHAAEGKDLLVFQMLGKGEGVRFLSAFLCDSWEYRQTPDRNGAIRRAIVFHLIPVAEGDAPIEPDGAATTSLAQLRNKAYELAAATPERRSSEAQRTYFERSAAIRIYAAARSNGKCEASGHPAPFMDSSGKPFLEVHHIRRLTDGGPDKPDGVAAICPNCHREAHHGERRSELNEDLLQAIQEKERLLMPG